MGCETFGGSHGVRSFRDYRSVFHHFGWKRDGECFTYAVSRSSVCGSTDSGGCGYVADNVVADSILSVSDTESRSVFYVPDSYGTLFCFICDGFAEILVPVFSRGNYSTLDVSDFEGSAEWSSFTAGSDDLFSSAGKDGKSVPWNFGGSDLVRAVLVGKQKMV